MKIKTIDHGYLKFLLLLILMAVFDYFEFSSISPFNYGLILTRIILILQYIPITIFNIDLFRKDVQYAIQNEIYLIFSLFIALNAIYISGLFSSGVYYVLFTSAPILPSMRTSAAIMMLNNGHIDMIDPHYLFPSEYIMVWLISKTTGLSASASYVIAFGFMKMLLWVSILLILVKIFSIHTVNENQLSSYASLYYKFLFIIMVLLFIFRPTGFYLGEFTIAGPLFLLSAVTMIKKGLNKSNVLSHMDEIILLLVALGILINSIRDVIALLMVSIFLVSYILITRNDLGLVRYVFYLVIILSVAKLIYFGAQYLTGYVGYINYLYHALLAALTIGFNVKRPPLHTVILAPSSAIDKVLNFAGSLDLFILLIIIGLLSLIGTYRSLREKNNRLLAGLALSIFLSFMVVSGVAALAYITNISGYFNLDFETFFSLMPYMYIIPLLYALLMNNKYKLRYSNSFTYKFIVSILIFTIVFSSLFSTFGLANRTVIRSQTDLSMIRNNPDAATYQVNRLYMFITEYYSKNNIYIGNSGFLQLYLTLPLAYRGIVPINYAYSCNLDINSNLIYYGQIFYIFLINNKYTLCGLNIILPY
jgi:hypothetical protein